MYPVISVLEDYDGVQYNCSPALTLVYMYMAWSCIHIVVGGIIHVQVHAIAIYRWEEWPAKFDSLCYNTHANHPRWKKNIERVKKSLEPSWGLNPGPSDCQYACTSSGNTTEFTACLGYYPPLLSWVQNSKQVRIQTLMALMSSRISLLTSFSTSGESTNWERENAQQKPSLGGLQKLAVDSTGNTTSWVC